MSKQIELEVVTNDKLHGVEHPVRLIPAFLRYIPVFNELLYNLLIVRLLKNDIEADFIYQRYSGESFCGARLSKIQKLPFVLEFNSSEVWKLKNWSQSRNPLKNALKTFVQLPITKRIERYNLQQASLIVVVSDSLRENLIAEGISSTKILVNPNGVDVKKFDEANPSIWKDKLDLNNQFVFGFIGTFGKWHGVLEMGSAIVQFYDQHPELVSKVKFLVVGDGKLFAKFKDIISSSAYSDQVICTGSVHQKDSPALLKSCDAFLSPHIKNPDGTKFFGSPTKLFEYMACAKPIIASDLDQIGEILTHKETAWMCQPNDVMALSEAMYQLYEDEDLQGKLGKNARVLVEKSYSWDNHVSHILRRIEERN
jgi:glycosyltransferase involved in cell wall biosynthesis